MTAFVTYVITIVMGLIMGILKMKEVENYWTEEFYDSAIKLKNKQDQKEEPKENGASI